MVCEKCNHEMQIGDFPFCPHGNDYRQYSGGTGFPFTTTHLNGKPVEVRSEGHLRELCKQYGVNHRPDVAFTEKRYEGIDFRTGQHKYREGSGAGLPGCWV